MRFVTFQTPNGRPEVGIQTDSAVTSLANLGVTSMLDLVTRWEEIRPQLDAKLGSEPKLSAGEYRLLAPIPRPNKLICVGLNYREHAIESKMAIPTTPVIFNKFATAVVGPGDSVVLPKMTEKPDYEAELAFVIGKGGRNISEASWKDHVFGYTIVNDVSARDIQLGSSQWLMGKTFDTFAPMGPAIVTADEIADPHNLAIRMTINGEILQDQNTRELIFGVPALIAYLSSVFTLEPGDIVSTGTPSGVGMGRTPPRWLKPGDEMVVFVEGIGELTNPCVAEGAAATA
jgi:2-keto-4-pentenoate hydratase/2-oxohepta-3-ene-1,7-dioic acid hydratase in catechol pathway